MPAWAWSSLAAAQRVRSVPKAAARRGAQTAPAPGKLAKSSWSVGAEGGRQARGADRPRPGEAREELVVRVGGEDRGDLALEGVDGLEQGPELGGVGLHRETERVDDRRVGGERLGGGHLVEPGVDHGGAAAVVLLIEPAHGGGARALDGRQRRPLDEKVASLPRVERADPVEGLREILFQQAGEPVGQAAAQIDELAPVERPCLTVGAVGEVDS